MNSDEVLDCLREELSLPAFNVKVEDKLYSEADYQAFKQDLLRYFEDYVQNIEN
ncbi:hypothetical protein [uncultured Enterococcus sp.]|uniref:hypothetical protein n=1 Tax=uncultured Enterococcus sp. TaxID=167972 RepID=UPI0025926F16|nr:hypothetical protein [uncultured Enterococcus sp.]